MRCDDRATRALTKKLNHSSIFVAFHHTSGDHGTSLVNAVHAAVKLGQTTRVSDAKADNKYTVRSTRSVLRVGKVCDSDQVSFRWQAIPEFD